MTLKSILRGGRDREDGGGANRSYGGYGKIDAIDRERTTRLELGRKGERGSRLLSDYRLGGGGTWVSHQSSLVEPRRAPAPGTSVFSLTLTP
jgi:hypothetical protein